MALDILGELEDMVAATAAVGFDELDFCASEQQTHRFQRLFGHSWSEAQEIIENRRRDPARKTVSDEHWQLVREEKERDGYDREAYEYAVEMRVTGCTKKSYAQPALSTQDSRAKYLVKLEGPLKSAQKIKELTETLELPTIFKGTGDSGVTNFCMVGEVVKRRLLSILENTFKPTFIRLNRADKDLSASSIAPTLGLDIEPTLPQHKLEIGQTHSPSQDEYPVWYFFYGTLADPEFLAKLLKLSEPPVLRLAVAEGGYLSVWGGKYKALLDAPVTATVDGRAYRVMSEDHEEQLRSYETDAYEVVRCTILMKDSEEAVKGLTFRFLGD